MAMHSLENTFWTAQYQNLVTGATGSGVVFATKNKLLGGDSNYFYIGDYQFVNDRLMADIHVVNHSGNFLGLFGAATDFPVQLEGDVNSNTMTLNGQVPNAPQFRVRIICTKRYALPAQPAEGFFFEGQQYDAHIIFLNIIKSATKTIKIADNYIGSNLFDTLRVSTHGSEITILTKRIEAGIKSLASAFKNQHSSIAIRLSDKFHDRFVIIDDKDYYHFGASLKDLGKKAFMFSKIEDPDVIATVAEKYKKEWDTGTVEV